MAQIYVLQSLGNRGRNFGTFIGCEADLDSWVPSRVETLSSGNVGNMRHVELFF